MTPLRRRMIDDMTLRNFTPKTIQAYVRCVARFALYFLTSPDRLGPEHIRAYLLYLLQVRHVSLSYYRGTRSALRFFYRVTLARIIHTHSSTARLGGSELAAQEVRRSVRASTPTPFDQPQRCV